MNHVDNALEHFKSRPLGDIKVMMIEDDPVITDIVTKMLSREGCVPYSTLTSSEAVMLAKNFMPDVVILDLMMPGISGEELLLEFKSDVALKSIPIIVFTNKSDDLAKKEVLERGADAFLVKASTELVTLVEVVKTLARKGSGTAPQT
jgi:two-component system, OmpR family, phosphate regulon response regulator PhoB